MSHRHVPQKSTRLPATKKAPAFSRDQIELRKPDAGRLGPVACSCPPALLCVPAKGLFLKHPGALSVAAVRIVVLIGRVAAMTDCSVVKIDKKSMIEVLHREHAFSDMFVAYLLTRNIRYEEDLVDQLFNSSEKRLARVLLLLAHFGKEGKPETVIPKMSQETLAEMIVSEFIWGMPPPRQVSSAIRPPTLLGE